MMRTIHRVTLENSIEVSVSLGCPKTHSVGCGKSTIRTITDSPHAKWLIPWLSNVRNNHNSPTTNRRPQEQQHNRSSTTPSPNKFFLISKTKRSASSPLEQPVWHRFCQLHPSHANDSSTASPFVATHSQPGHQQK